MSYTIFGPDDFNKFFHKEISKQYVVDTDIQCFDNAIIANEHEHGFGVFDKDFKFVKYSLQMRKNNGQFIPEFNHENIFLSRGLKMWNGPCELIIDNKQRDEVLISLNIPKNKFHGVHNFKALIFIRKKGECMQSYDLDEYSEDYNFYYLKKKIPY